MVARNDTSKASARGGSPDSTKRSLDRFAELAHIGAGHAATALAQLVGETIWIEVPFVAQDSFQAPLGRTQALRHSTGVHFEFEGGFEGLVGILFPTEASEALIRRLVGIESGPLEPDLCASAFMEVGNILASHVASAIADSLGETVLPSVPTIAMEHAETAFAERVRASLGADAICIDTGFHAEAGSLHGRLVVVPARAEWSRPVAGSRDPTTGRAEL